MCLLVTLLLLPHCFHHEYPAEDLPVFERVPVWDLVLTYAEGLWQEQTSSLKGHCVIWSSMAFVTCWAPSDCCCRLISPANVACGEESLSLSKWAALCSSWKLYLLPEHLFGLVLFCWFCTRTVCVVNGQSFSQNKIYFLQLPQRNLSLVQAIHKA